MNVNDGRSNVSLCWICPALVSVDWSARCGDLKPIRLNWFRSCPSQAKPGALLQWSRFRGDFLSLQDQFWKLKNRMTEKCCISIWGKQLSEEVSKFMQIKSLICEPKHANKALQLYTTTLDKSLSHENSEPSNLRVVNLRQVFSAAEATRMPMPSVNRKSSRSPNRRFQFFCQQMGASWVAKLWLHTQCVVIAD